MSSCIMNAQKKTAQYELAVFLFVTPCVALCCGAMVLVLCLVVIALF